MRLCVLALLLAAIPAAASAQTAGQRRDMSLDRLAQDAVANNLERQWLLPSLYRRVTGYNEPVEKDAFA